MTKIILTEELRAEILGYIEDGRSLRSMMSMLPIGKTKYYEFIDENADFAEQVQRARAKGKINRKGEAEECILDCIRKGDGHLAMKYLECSHPNEYAKRRIQENTGEAAPFDRLLETLEKLHDKESEE